MRIPLAYERCESNRRARRRSVNIVVVPAMRLILTISVPKLSQTILMVRARAHTAKRLSRQASCGGTFQATSRGYADRTKRHSTPPLGRRRHQLLARERAFAQNHDACLSSHCTHLRAHLSRTTLFVPSRIGYPFHTHRQRCVLTYLNALRMPLYYFGGMARACLPPIYLPHAHPTPTLLCPGPLPAARHRHCSALRDASFRLNNSRATSPNLSSTWSRLTYLYPRFIDGRP